MKTMTAATTTARVTPIRTRSSDSSAAETLRVAETDQQDQPRASTAERALCRLCRPRRRVAAPWNEHDARDDEDRQDHLGGEHATRAQERRQHARREASGDAIMSPIVMTSVAARYAGRVRYSASDARAPKTRYDPRRLPKLGRTSDATPTTIFMLQGRPNQKAIPAAWAWVRLSVFFSKKSRGGRCL
jgi:hypothetical protein